MHRDKDKPTKCKPVCKHCGSENIVFNAQVIWDDKQQKYVALDIYDEGHHCSDCQNEDCHEWEYR